MNIFADSWKSWMLNPLDWPIRLPISRLSRAYSFISSLPSATSTGV